jgi:hypothetical protein
MKFLVLPELILTGFFDSVFFLARSESKPFVRFSSGRLFVSNSLLFLYLWASRRVAPEGR